MLTFADAGRVLGPGLRGAAGIGLLCLAASCASVKQGDGGASRPTGASASAPAATAPAMPAASRPALNAEQRAAVERMLAAVDHVRATLVELGGIRTQTPEFLLLTPAWQRRRLEALLLLNRDGPPRAAALREYLAAVQRTFGIVDQRGPLDGSLTSKSVASFAVAEAEYLAASDGVVVVAQTPEQKAAAERMVIAGMEEVRGLEGSLAMRSHTPEALLGLLNAYRRQCDSDLLLNPAGPRRQAIVDLYLAQARKCYADVWARRNIDATPATLAMAEYAVADAELLAADPGTRPAAAPEVVARLLEAAKQANVGLLQTQFITSLSEERLELRVEWMKRQLAAERLAHPLAAERRKALDAYGAGIKELAQYVETRIPIDSTPMKLAMMEYALAEVDYFVAGGDGE